MSALDQNKLNDFLGKVVSDVGGAMSAALVVLGDQLVCGTRSPVVVR
jgi:hypothetical protein